MRVDVRPCPVCGEPLIRRGRESPAQFAERKFCGRKCQGIARAGCPKERFWPMVKVAGPDDCWEWQGRRTERGYGEFHYRQKPWRAHRFALVLRGYDVDGWVVLHRCDNPPCCNPNHLRLGTPADNNADMMVKGRSRHFVGSQNRSAKLTDDAVRAIRASREGLPALASRYGVAKSVICNVRNRKTWRHVT